MKTAGVICEYNPFHYGHKYQLELIKKDFDGVVCVMSGSFVQRGEVALYDKWSRAKAALLNGADLVLELPVRFCLSSAQDFAKGGVDLLIKTGIIDSLCFGSECADTKKLRNAAKTMLAEPPEVSEKLQMLLKEGYSFPKARELAYNGIIDSELISRPNDILALEYIGALLKLEGDITAIALPRKAVDHNSTAISGIYASATVLREKLAEGEDISQFTPFDFSGCERYDTAKLSDIFRYRLLKDGSGIFDGISGNEPGLSERFLKCAGAGSLSDIIDAVKTKRYTHARLKRLALCSILGISGTFSENSYIRVLGMTDIGRELLSQMKKSAKAPVVNKVADFKEENLSQDILSTDIAALCSSRKIPSGRDFTTSPVYIKNQE